VLGHGDCVNQVIERTPQIVDAVTGNQRPPFDWWLAFGSRYNDAVLSKIITNPFDVPIRTMVEVGENFILERLKVFFGSS
jgi:hypothetical protein